VLNADEHYDVAFEFKLINYMTDKSRIIAWKGTLSLHCNNARCVE
jgi:hypothetical protein